MQLKFCHFVLCILGYQNYHSVCMHFFVHVAFSWFCVGPSFFWKEIFFCTIVCLSLHLWDRLTIWLIFGSCQHGIFLNLPMLFFQKPFHRLLICHPKPSMLFERIHFPKFMPNLEKKHTHTLCECKMVFHLKLFRHLTSNFLPSCQRIASHRGEEMKSSAE